MIREIIVTPSGESQFRLTAIYPGVIIRKMHATITKSDQNMIGFYPGR